MKSILYTPKLVLMLYCRGSIKYLVSNSRTSTYWILRGFRQFELICTYAPEDLKKQIEYKEADLNIGKKRKESLEICDLFVP